MRIENRHGQDLTVGEGRTLIMGVVNVTPDSFSDGGQFLGPEAAIRHGLRLADEGADILDIGGESSRPGYQRVSVEEQLRRILPVVEGLRAKSSVPLSIDTTRAAVAARTLEAGADWINDTTALQEDPELADLVAASSCPVILMHRFDPPREPGDTVAGAAAVDAMVDHLARRAEFATSRGIDPRRIILDPGLGFGTLFTDNLQAMADVRPFRRLSYPLLFGPSRKSFIGQMTDRSAEQRVHGTAAAVAILAMQSVEIIRVHDVAAMVDVVRVADSLRNSRVG